MKRVSKPGAWIITAGIRDYGSIPYYPPRPLLNKVWTSLRKYMEARRESLSAGVENSKGYWDFDAARKCVEWYAKADINDIRIHSWIEDWWYPGFSDIEAMRDGMTLEFYRTLIEDAVSDGFLKPEIAVSAFLEGKKWIKNPYAYSNHPLVTIFGRV